MASRRSGSEKQNCCCCSLILPLIFIFLVWVIAFPQNPKFTVTDASLTQFTFTNVANNMTLHYNLALNITIRNPNKKLAINYRRFRVIGNYRKKRFAMVTLPNTTIPFKQGHKNTTVLHDIVVQGQQVVKFGEKEISQYDSETASGIYSIDTVLALRVKLRLGGIKFHNYGPDNIHCRIRVPLNRNRTTTSAPLTGGFNATRCTGVNVNCHWFFLFLVLSLVSLH